MDQIKLFSPATIANISCGFDVLGLALDTIGDEMIIKKVNHKGIKISKIEGQNLPLEATKNVAGVAALAILNAVESSFGFEIEIYKNIKPGSGIGSSAASAAGAVWGINELLGSPFNKTELVQFAMEGEALASGCYHADNVAPALFGGFTLVRSYEPLDVININTPKDLFVTVIHPHIEIKTVEARAILSPNVPLKDAIKQWGNVGGLVCGLFMEDYSLIGRSLEDYIVEPYRAKLIPHFYDVKNTALKAGALGCGISGSGPSIFTLCKGEHSAKEVELALRENYKKTGIPFDIYVSKINTEGIKII